MISVKLSMGGDGEQVEIPVTITGCSCRVEDFLMELTRFTNDWKNVADLSLPSAKPKPCGCKDA
jgi:hypothetical protein